MTEQVVHAEVVDEEEVAAARNLPAVRASEAMVARDEITPDDVVAQHAKIEQVMQAVMKDGMHYGKVPGVSKPTLLKPGAEVLAVTFRLAPSYESQRTYHDGGHLTVVSKVTLTHIPTGLVLGEGEGLCTTYEKKYAYRGEGRTCPSCGAAAIKKSKYPPREGDYPGASKSDAPGWFCFAKLGGCGVNFAATDPAITEQETGKVPNPDLPDSWNTVLKMANKRGLVAAVLNVTGASDVFTQDVEDLGSHADPDARGGERSAVPPKSRKVRDIEQLFADADKKRGSEAGTTATEARQVRDTPLVELADADLDALGQALGQFVYGTLTPEQMNERGFAAFYGTDVPFA